MNIRFLKEMEILGIIRRQGGLYRFTHETLNRYLQGLQAPFNQNTSRQRGSLLAGCGLILIILGWQIGNHRNHFWQDGSILHGFEITNHSTEELELRDHKISVRQNGRLVVNSSGRICAGRILGDVSPIGTQTGFFAMPLSHTYNIGNLRDGHGAIIYRRPPDTSWHLLHNNDKVRFMHLQRAIPVYSDTISVKAGDLIELHMNDKEPENNLGKFDISLKFISG